MKCSAILLLALIGAAYAKRQVILSPPTAVPSPPPPPPPGTPPAPAPETFPTPGFLWSVVVPGYTQATFGPTQQSQLCDLLINRDVQEIATENCQITTISTYNGSNAQVSGFTYWGWKKQPSITQINTATALRDFAILQLKTNSTSLFAPTFKGVIPNCACDGMNEVTRSGNLDFVYKNLTIVPASAQGPAQCGAKLSYDSNVPSNVINQVGVESAAGGNFGKFCAPGGVAGGVVGTPGVGTCRQYGVVAQAPNTNQATATSNNVTTGAWNGVAALNGGSGYSVAPAVTIAAPTPVAITPTFPLNSANQISQSSFATSNGPYSTAPGLSQSTQVCFQCTSSNCAGAGYSGSAVCTGTTQQLQIGANTFSGPTCTSNEWGSIVVNTQVTGFTIGGAVIGAATNNVICTTIPQVVVDQSALQPAVTATATAAINNAGAVTTITLISGGSGYLYGTQPGITIAGPSTNDIGKLCSPTPIPGLAGDIAVATAITITPTGQCQPLGLDTFTKTVCSVPAVRNGLSAWNKLGVQTCNVISSFKAQPNSQQTDSCLLLPQTFITAVSGSPAPAPAPKPAPSPAPKPAPSPAPSPAPRPSPPAPLVCSYRGIYEIIPLYAPCNRYRIASGTDSDCDYNLVTLRTAGQVGAGKIARLHWEFATIAEDNLSVPTNVLARARRGCTNKYLAAPSDPTTLKTGGASWKWQFVPFPGSSSCEEVNVISQNRLSTTAFLQVPNTCDRFRYNATDGGRQRFRLRKITL